ncbi:unnamed protein product [Camellia sinensis]
MDPSSAQHHQEIATHQTLESMLVCTKTNQEKKPRPQPEQAQKCPRCESTNTKFCYYNNYSLSQPRYFCKSCKRYWTKGGTLRNVPVGGGCRKNRRSSPPSKRSQDDHQPLIPTHHNPLSTLPCLTYDSNDLSLAFARLHNQPNGHLGFDHDHHHHDQGVPMFDVLGNPNVQTYGTTPHAFLEAPNGFHGLYYGMMGNGGGASVNVSGEMVRPYEDMTVTTMKQELSNGREGENRVLWGFPWQISGDANMGDVDSGRESWNAFGSSWHGLLHSPLM